MTLLFVGTTWMSNVNHSVDGNSRKNFASVSLCLWRHSPMSLNLVMSEWELRLGQATGCSIATVTYWENHARISLSPNAHTRKQNFIVDSSSSSCACVIKFIISMSRQLPCICCQHWSYMCGAILRWLNDCVYHVSRVGASSWSSGRATQASKGASIDSLLLVTRPCRSIIGGALEVPNKHATYNQRFLWRHQNYFSKCHF